MNEMVVTRVEMRSPLDDNEHIKPDTVPDNEGVKKEPFEHIRTGIKIKDYIDSMLDSPEVRAQLTAEVNIGNSSDSDSNLTPVKTGDFIRQRLKRLSRDTQSLSDSDNESMTTDGVRQVRMQALIEKVLDRNPSLNLESGNNLDTENVTVVDHSPTIYGMNAAAVACMTPIQGIRLREKRSEVNRTSGSDLPSEDTGSENQKYDSSSDNDVAIVKVESAVVSQNIVNNSSPTMKSSTSLNINQPHQRTSTNPQQVLPHQLPVRQPGAIMRTNNHPVGSQPTVNNHAMHYRSYPASRQQRAGLRGRHRGHFYGHRQVNGNGVGARQPFRPNGGMHMNMRHSTPTVPRMRVPNPTNLRMQQHIMARTANASSSSNMIRHHQPSMNMHPSFTGQFVASNMAMHQAVAPNMVVYPSTSPNMTVHHSVPPSVVHHFPSNSMVQDEPLNLKKEVALDLSVKNEKEEIKITKDGVLDLSVQKKTTHLPSTPTVPVTASTEMKTHLSGYSNGSYTNQQGNRHQVPVQGNKQHQSRNVPNFRVGVQQPNHRGPKMPGVVQDVRPSSQRSLQASMVGNTLSKDNRSAIRLLGGRNPSDILYLHCNHCPSSYGSIYTFKKHFRNVHGFEPVSDDIRIQTLSETKEHFGLNEISNQAEMIPPSASVNEGICSNQRPVMYQCRFCGMQFTLMEETQFWNHVKAHGSLQPPIIECCYCNMRFSTSMQLHYHLKEHREALPHFCTSCFLAFQSQSTLTTHSCFGPPQAKRGNVASCQTPSLPCKEEGTFNHFKLPDLRKVICKGASYMPVSKVPDHVEASKSGVQKDKHAVVVPSNTHRGNQGTASEVLEKSPVVPSPKQSGTNMDNGLFMEENQTKTCGDKSSFHDKLYASIDNAYLEQTNSQSDGENETCVIDSQDETTEAKKNGGIKTPDLQLSAVEEKQDVSKILQHHEKTTVIDEIAEDILQKDSGDLLKPETYQGASELLEGDTGFQNGDRNISPEQVVPSCVKVDKPDVDVPDLGQDTAISCSNVRSNPIVNTVVVDDKQGINTVRPLTKIPFDAASHEQEKLTSVPEKISTDVCNKQLLGKNIDALDCEIEILDDEKNCSDSHQENLEGEKMAVKEVNSEIMNGYLSEMNEGLDNDRGTNGWAAFDEEYVDTGANRGNENFMVITDSVNEDGTINLKIQEIPMQHQDPPPDSKSCIKMKICRNKSGEQFVAKPAATGDSIGSIESVNESWYENDQFPDPDYSALQDANMDCRDATTRPSSDQNDKMSANEPLLESSDELGMATANKCVTGTRVNIDKLTKRITQVKQSLRNMKRKPTHDTDGSSGGKLKKCVVQVARL